MSPRVDDLLAEHRPRASARARSTARHLAIDLLAALHQVSGRTAHLDARARVHLLYLHSVPEPELPRFRALVDRLVTAHAVVSYSHAVHLIESDADPSTPVFALSFDDGFRSNVAVSRVLDDLGVQACFFVPTGFVGCSTVSAARAFFGTAAGVDEPAMSRAELEDLVARGHEVGNHTVRHRVLSTLSSAEANDEIATARDMLRSWLGQGEHFAWPRGRFAHFAPGAARAVFELGHRSCASAERGAHLPSSTRANPCLRRDHLMTSWPSRHLDWFVSRGARRMCSGEWPAGWEVS